MNMLHCDLQKEKASHGYIVSFVFLLYLQKYFYNYREVVLCIMTMDDITVQCYSEKHTQPVNTTVVVLCL